MEKVGVMLCEENRDEIEILTDIMNRAGLTVVSVNNNIDDIAENVRKYTPGLIIINVNLCRRKDNSSIINNIQSQYNISVVYTVSDIDDKTREIIRETKPYGFIVKPFKEEIVQATIQMALNRHTSELDLRKGWKYEDIFNLAQDAITILNREGVIVTCNDAAVKFSGYSRKEIIGKHFSELESLQAKDIPMLMKMMNRLLSGEHPAPFEIIWKHKNGSYKFSEVQLSILKEDNQITGFVTFARDITDRKQAERAIREKTKELELIIGNAPIGFSYLDNQMRILRINKFIEKRFGIKPDDIKYHYCYDIFGQYSKDDSRKGKERICDNCGVVKALEDGKIHVHERMIKDNYIIRSTSIPIAGENGKIEGVIEVIEDITNIKLAEEALHESEEKFRNIAEMATEAIILSDNTGNVAFWNRAAQKIFGYNTEEILGKSVNKLLSPRFRNMFEKLFTSNNLKESLRYINSITELKGLRRDGTEFPAEFSLSSWKLKGQRFFTAIVRDITERKRAETEIKNKSEDISLINKLNQAVNHGKSLKEIIRILSKETMRIFNCTGATVYLLDDNRDYLVMQNFTLSDKIKNRIEKMIKTKIPEVKIPLKEGSIYQKTLQNGKAVLIKDPQTIQQLMGEFTNNKFIKRLIPQIYAFLKYKSVINLPLASEGEVIGMMDIASHGIFSQSDLQRLETIAAQLTFILIHKQAEEKIHEHTEFLTNVLKSLTHPFYVIDAEDYTIKMANPAASKDGITETMTCYSLTHNRSEPCNGFNHPCTLGKVKTTRQATVLEHIHVGPNGEKRYMEVHGYPIFDEKGNVIQMLEYCLDITQRKKAEEDIRKSRKNLQTILDSMPFGVVTIKKSRQILSANETALRLIGYETEDRIIGKNCSEIFCVTEAGECPILDRGEELDRSEKILVTRDGDQIPILKSVIPIEIDDEVVFLETFIDIRDRKQAEEALQKWAHIFEHAEWGVVISSPDGKHLDMMNPAFARMHGYTVEELTGRPIKDVFAPESRKELQKQIAIAHEKGHYTFEAEHLRKDGTIFPVLIDVTAVKNKEGKVLYRAVNVQDITESKKAQKALIESEEKYRKLFEESIDVIFMSSAKGEILDINPAGVDLFGYSSRNELLGKNIFEDLYFNPQAKESYRKTMEKYGFVKDYELIFKRKNGEKVFIQETSSVIRTRDGKIKGYRGILRDVTRQKLLEQQLLQAQKMEALGILAGGIAHDFNNILTAIIGNAEIGLMQLEPANPLYESFETIEKTATKAAELTRKILAFSRKQILEPKVIDLNKLILDFSKMLRRIVSENIELRIITTDQSCPVFADPGAMEQVLMNLAVNSRDAMEDGGVFTLITERISLNDEKNTLFPDSAAGEYILLTVKDTGVGIPESLLPKVFEPFFTTKDVGKGTGLGLSVVHGIIKQHNGYIDVESKTGKGASFKILLPVSHGEEEKEEKKKDASIPTGTETVLIAEDEELIRKMSKEILQSFGYKVLLAEDGADALSVFLKYRNKIDLVILDMIMPKMGGVQVYREIQKIVPSMAVMFITGYSSEITKLEKGSEFKAPIIKKPFTMKTLAKKVREILDKDI